MYDAVLHYCDRLEFTDQSWISIYQKMYKYVADNEMSATEFTNLEYTGTKSYTIFLHNPEQRYDSDYDFKLIVDKWQLDHIINILKTYRDVSYNSIRGWFAELSEEVHSLNKGVAGPLFNRRVVYSGIRTTELMIQYHVFNKEDPFK